MLGDFYQSPYAKTDDYTEITKLLSKLYGYDYDIVNVMKRVSSVKRISSSRIPRLPNVPRSRIVRVRGKPS